MIDDLTLQKVIKQLRSAKAVAVVTVDAEFGTAVFCANAPDIASVVLLGALQLAIKEVTDTCAETRIGKGVR